MSEPNCSISNLLFAGRSTDTYTRTPLWCLLVSSLMGLWYPEIPKSALESNLTITQKYQKYHIYKTKCGFSQALTYRVLCVDPEDQ